MNLPDIIGKTVVDVKIVNEGIKDQALRIYFENIFVQIPYPCDMEIYEIPPKRE